MQNAVMQHAIAKAHHKAAQKKTNTVAKGAVSLAGTYNKRATDNPQGAMQKSDQSMPQAAEAALANAVQAMHDDATKEIAVSTPKAAEKPAAQNNVTDLSDIPRVVFRSDMRGNLYCFMVDTMDIAKNTICMYDIAHGGEKEEVLVDFYRTLKPVDRDAREKAVGKMSKKLGVARLLVRDRLLKSHMLERDTEGKVDAKGLDELQAKLLNAVKQFEQAIQAAFQSA